MPIVGLVAALCWSFWVAVGDAGDSLAQRLSSFAEAAVWPGVLIFLATTAIVWLAWKVDLD
jgi:hypothetical protein